MHQTYLFKVIVAGEGGVGKTTLVNRYATNMFKKDTKITIGVSFYSFAVNVNGGEIPVKLQVWDFGGEKRFRFILPSYCKGAHGVIFAFDLTRTTSLWNLEEWFDLVKTNTHAKPLYLLIGTKVDLIEQKGPKMMSLVDEQTSKFLKKHELSPDLFIKTSSLTGENISDVFTKIANLIYKRMNNGD